jgi:hypothetical protein
MLGSTATVVVLWGKNKPFLDAHCYFRVKGFASRGLLSLCAGLGGGN